MSGLRSRVVEAGARVLHNPIRVIEGVAFVLVGALLISLSLYAFAEVGMIVVEWVLSVVEEIFEVMYG